MSRRDPALRNAASLTPQASIGENEAAVKGDHHGRITKP
jgi:hypothetical protein